MNAPNQRRFGSFLSALVIISALLAAPLALANPAVDQYTEPDPTGGGDSQSFSTSEDGGDGTAAPPPVTSIDSGSPTTEPTTGDGGGDGEASSAGERGQGGDRGDSADQRRGSSPAEVAAAAPLASGESEGGLAFAVPFLVLLAASMVVAVVIRVLGRRSEQGDAES